MRYMYAKFVYDRINGRRIKLVISINDVCRICNILSNYDVTAAYYSAAFINKDDYEFFFTLFNDWMV